MNEILTLTYLFHIFGCFIVGTLLLVIKTAPRLKDKMYLRAKATLGVVTLFVAAGNIGVFFSRAEDVVDIFSFSVLLTATIHVCLFTFLIFIIFHSEYVTKRNIIKHLLPAIVFIILYGVAQLYSPKANISTFKNYIENFDNPIVVIRTMFAVVYLVQIIISISLFHRERKVFLDKIDNYFSDSERYSLQWASRRFYEAMLIGVLLLLFCLFPDDTFDMAVNILVMVFYFSFAVNFINFQYKLFYMLPAVEQSATQETATPTPETDKKDKTDQILNSMHLEKQLQEILETKCPYLWQNVSISDISALLNVPDRRLSHHINNVYGQNFNRWINTLRIEYAKEQMAQNTSLSFEQLAECSGFSSKSKFSNVFREITGISYSEYKKKMLEA